MSSVQYQGRIYDRITDIEPAAWDALLGPDPDPMVEHGNLAAIELSGMLASTCSEPRHVTVWSGGTLVAAAPAYRKTGGGYEPLPDWARKLAERHGLPYDPILHIGVPRLPLRTPKLLVAPGIDRREAIGELMALAKKAISDASCPVIHVYMGRDEDTAELGRLGFHLRESPRIAWHNPGFPNFEASLQPLSQRRDIRRERRRLAEAGVRVRAFRGAALTTEHMDLLWHFHEQNMLKYDAEGFANRAYLELLRERVSERTEVLLAERGSTPVGAMLNANARDVIYLRMSGVAPDAPPFTHLELFYRSMELAIERGQPWIDPGPPSEHKLRRGFLPAAPNFHATWVGDPDMNEAVTALLAKERAYLDQMRHPGAPSALDPRRSAG